MEISQTQNIKMTPRDFFMHLAGAAGLYVSAVSLINLLLEIINVAFPDRLDYYVDPYSGAVRWSIAMLVIVFPTYLLLLWAIERDVKANPGKKQLGIRRWLAYLTLFLAGVTIIVDLVVLINSFLGGELSLRFFLKVLAVFIVAGAVFGFYLYDLRREADKPTKGLKTFSVAAIVLVIASLLAGFLVMGSPSNARKMRFDERRINDLTTIQWQIVDHWQRTGSLPPNLEALNDPLTGFIAPNDPETSTPYEYVRSSPVAFKLCSTFSTESKSTRVRESYARPAPPLIEGETWTHGVGHVCFDRVIDPSRYPPRKQ